MTLIICDQSRSGAKCLPKNNLQQRAETVGARRIAEVKATWL